MVDLILLIAAVGGVIVAPVVYVLVRGLSAGSALTKRTRRLLQTGALELGQIVTVGQSPLNAAYDGGTKLLRMTVRLGTGDVVIDQMIPKVAVGGFHPGSEVIVRVDPIDRQQAVIDLYAMGYR